uniref:Knottin scorpion toxin-like domain-containing protein n=1 Tax=Leersia perrieri TaxID=77586 RepID=A0A0D9WQK9_9ORYZ
MARIGAAAIALLVLVSLVASAAATEPHCCVDFHSWGDGSTGCGPDQNDACNSWCQSQCRGGECKLRGDHHFCHCFC